MMKKIGYTMESALSSTTCRGTMATFVLFVTILFSNTSFGWTEGGNDVSNVFNVCSQYEENLDRKYRSINGCEGSYIWNKGDVGINGFATETGFWPGKRHENVINNPPYNLVIPERLSWKSNSGSRKGSGVVTYLCKEAFRGEDWLLSVSIPSTIEIYGWGLFAGCKSLNSVTLNCSLISSSMFSGCTSLRHIDIPDGVVTNISRQAFKGSGLVEVSIPGSVGHICENAFANCTNLSSVVINEGVLGIDGRAFAECTSLLSVEIPKSVKSIKQNAFDGCTSMTNLVLHGGVHVCDEAFTSCYSLKTIVVANSDDEVGATVFDGQAFAWCRNLESVVFDGNAPSAGERIFRGVSASTCTVYVHHGSTGWGVDIPGKWKGVRIEYIEDVGLPTTFDVAFDANGGTVSPQTLTVEGGTAVGDLPIPMRNGYLFLGWFTAGNGGDAVTAGTIITTNMTLYAQWSVVTPQTPDPADTSDTSLTPKDKPTRLPTSVTTDEPLNFAGNLDTKFDTAQTVDGAMYKGNTFIGTVQVKVGKVNKKGVVKVSATATLKMDGKAKKVTAKAVNVKLDATGLVPPMKIAFKEPIGEMEFEMAATGNFTLKNRSYLMAKATIGKELKGGAHGTFRMENFGLAVSGELQNDLLPVEEAFSVSGGKWAFAKAATVKWARDRVTKESGLVVDTSNGKTNLSGLKLTYTSKTGQFKGSFKAYALETANGKAKLVKYTVNVIGFVVDGVGHGEASCKKPSGGPWTVTVE